MASCWARHTLCCPELLAKKQIGGVCVLVLQHGPLPSRQKGFFFLFMLNNSKCIDFTGVRNAIVVYIASRTDLVAMCEVKVKLSSEAGLN